MAVEEGEVAGVAGCGCGGHAAKAAPRSYRVSGIQALRVLQQPACFVLAAHWSLAVAEFEARLMAGRVVGRLLADGLRILRAVQLAAAEWVLCTQRMTQRAGWIEAELPNEPDAYAARQLLRLGTEVEVLAPATPRVAEASGVAKHHRRRTACNGAGDNRGP